MEWLVDVVRGLIIVVFFVNVAQLLLPESGLRGYVRLVMGLLVIAALITPILELFRLDYGLQRQLFGSGPAGADTYVAAGQELAAAAQQRLSETARSRFVQQVASVTALAAGVEPDQVEVAWGAGGEAETIRVVLPADSTGREPDADRVRRVVAQFFGLSLERVEIRITRF